MCHRKAAADSRDQDRPVRVHVRFLRAGARVQQQITECWTSFLSVLLKIHRGRCLLRAGSSSRWLFAGGMEVGFQ